MGRPTAGGLFFGYGGLDLAAAEVYDCELVWYSEIDPGASLIAAHRFPGVPNLGDITKIDWSRVPPVDVLTGGFPCTDLSKLGKRAGLSGDTRSGLWSHMAAAVRELRPRLVLAENVRQLLSGEATSTVEPCPWCLGDRPELSVRACGVVLADLADIGYDADWCCLRASECGALHERERVFLAAAPTDTDRLPVHGVSGVLRGTMPGQRSEGQPHPYDREPGRSDRLPERGTPGSGIDSWREYAPLAWGWEHVTGHPAPHVEESLARIEEWMMGLPAGWVTEVPGLKETAQTKALGNGVVPQQAAAAFRLLESRW